MSSHFGFALEVHSILRLTLTVLSLWLFVRGLRGWLGERGPSQTSKLLLLFATIVADLQLILGLLLYFAWSPTASQARADMGAAMKDPTLRYWAVEHGSAMLLVVLCVHAGKVFAGKSTGDSSRCRRIALWFGIVLALILLMSPWPFSSIVRPFLRV